ncbi:MAG: alpha/beta fold hydrolase, partial [Lachnospiraceae bacterium]|nr:alpha/beta fold hydrolase [Lachnospiraceae bacterium]
MSNHFEEFEDRIRLGKVEGKKANQYSRYCDFVYYNSSVNPELTLAMRVLKPEKPSYILAGTHGWHQSIPKFEELTAPASEYLQIQVDMRGRAFSDGKQDCNGLELMDVIDAIEYVKEHYSEYILDKEVVYFQAGSGGGGNAFAIAGKFPDYFAHVVSTCGMSDYALWHQNDRVGEFRDELDVWIGDISNPMAYAS